jgi:hypothetical protein
LRYESATGHSLVDCDIIFEVGGGYGSFCRLLKNAGFNGLHIIYDLPHVAAIQRLYLGASGFDDVPQVEVSQRNHHGFCLVSDDALNSAFNILAACKLCIGFVATWSLSEFPLGARKRVLPRFLDICSQYLIAYQPHFFGVNNEEYFDTLREQRPELGWQKEDVSSKLLSVCVALMCRVQARPRSTIQTRVRTNWFPTWASSRRSSRSASATSIDGSAPPLRGLVGHAGSFLSRHVVRRLSSSHQVWRAPANNPVSPGRRPGTASHRAARTDERRSLRPRGCARNKSGSGPAHHFSASAAASLWC